MDVYTESIRYFTKTGQMIKMLLAKPEGILALIPVIAAPKLTTPEKALILLACLYIGDFITGVWASYVEFKKSIPVVPASGKRYVVQSSKLRLSVIKFVTYGLMILVAFGIEWVFVLQEFEPHPKLNKMTLTTMAIGFCCLIEAYSILFENIKRIGFDIIQKVKTMAKSGWDLYKDVKDDNKK